ncbi:MAG: hypothetical protein OEV30_00305 [Ignavibacteria bacterium]|nr:hypothetical protein [Ignavibacteria bacterium]
MLKQYLTFRKMLSPTLLRVMFWPASAACIYFSIALIRDGYAIGWVPLIIGTIFVRVLFEGMILFFSIHEHLSDFHTALADGQRSVKGAGS